MNSNQTPPTPQHSDPCPTCGNPGGRCGLRVCQQSDTPREARSWTLYRVPLAASLAFDSRWQLADDGTTLHDGYETITVQEVLSEQATPDSGLREALEKIINLDGGYPEDYKLIADAALSTVKEAEDA